MEITIEKMPDSVESYIALRDRLAQNPEGATACFIIAMYLFCQNHELGMAAITIASDKSRLSTGNSYKGFTLGNADLSLLKMQLEKAPYLPNSYFANTLPDNGYQLPASPLKINLSENPSSGDKAMGRFKLFVACTGADSPRPITLQVNDKGVWKAIEWSSLLTGIRKPPVSDGDDL